MSVEGLGSEDRPRPDPGPDGTGSVPPGVVGEQPAYQPSQPQHAAGPQWGAPGQTATQQQQQQQPVAQQWSLGQATSQPPTVQQQQQQAPGQQWGIGQATAQQPQHSYQAQHQAPPQNYAQAPQPQQPVQPPQSYQQPQQYPQHYSQQQQHQYPQPPEYSQQPQFQQPGGNQYGLPPNWQLPLAVVVPSAPKLPGRVKAGASVILVLALAAVTSGVLAAKAGTGGAAASRTTGQAAQDQKVDALWRTASAGDLLPLSLSREGTETYQRIGVDSDESCSVLPAALLAALKPGSCAKVIQATYVDRTQTVTATVGIVVISGSSDVKQSVYKNWTPDSNAANTAMMPNTYPVPGTAAANFQDAQRVAWQSNILNDGSYLVYAVAGFSDGRTGPSAADRSANTGSALDPDSPPVQVAGDLPTAISQILVAQETTILGTSGS